MDNERCYTSQTGKDCSKLLDMKTILKLPALSARLRDFYHKNPGIEISNSGGELMVKVFCACEQN